MNSIMKTIFCMALLAAGTSLAAAPVDAAAASVQPSIVKVAASELGLVVAVRARGRLKSGRNWSRRGTYGKRHRYSGSRNYRNRGRNLGLGSGALVIGGIALSGAARAQHRGNHPGDWQRCADNYRSFEAHTGMYTGYDGIRRPCPYLN